MWVRGRSHPTRAWDWRPVGFWWGQGPEGAERSLGRSDGLEAVASRSDPGPGGCLGLKWVGGVDVGMK